MVAGNRCFGVVSDGGGADFGGHLRRDRRWICAGCKTRLAGGAALDVDGMFAAQHRDPNIRPVQGKCALADMDQIAVGCELIP